MDEEARRARTGPLRSPTTLFPFSPYPLPFPPNKPITYHMASMQTLSRSAGTTSARRAAGRVGGAVKVHAIKSQTPYRDELIATVSTNAGRGGGGGGGVPAQRALTCGVTVLCAGPGETERASGHRGGRAGRVGRGAAPQPAQGGAARKKTLTPNQIRLSSPPQAKKIATPGKGLLAVSSAERWSRRLGWEGEG